MNSTPLPPPDPSTGVAAPMPTAPGRPSRGRTAAVSVVAAGLALGGIVSLSQFAGAEEPTLVDATAADAPGGPGAPDAPESPTDLGDDITIGGFEDLEDVDPQCIAEQMGQIDLGQIDLGDIDLPMIDLGAIDLGALDLNGIDLSELGLDGLEDFDFDDAEWGEAMMVPHVAVFDGTDMSFVDFGEGDGSVTITKSGDDISITSDGDVEVNEDAFSVPAIDFEMIDGELTDIDPTKIAETLGIDPSEIDELLDELKNIDIGELGDLDQLGESVEVFIDDIDAQIEAALEACRTGN